MATKKKSISKKVQRATVIAAATEIINSILDYKELWKEGTKGDPANELHFLPIPWTILASMK